MQLKYCFKKEWSLFSRTGRIFGVIAALIFFAVSNPLLFKFTGTVLEQMNSLPGTTFASVAQSTDFSGISPNVDSSVQNGLGIDYSTMADMYSDSEMMFGVTMAYVCSNSLLVIMLLLMPAAGGEQKKRSMIVPLCSGLKYENYLLSKFIIYPIFMLVSTFLSGLLAGALCNGLFPNNKIPIDLMLAAAIFAAIYMLFITSVYLSVGICTSHPGIMTAAVYLGTIILQSLLEGLGLSQFHPFTLLTLASGGMFTEDFVLSENILNISVSIGLSLVISVLMYFLALGVLNAKKINNKEEVKPEF